MTAYIKRLTVATVLLLTVILLTETRSFPLEALEAERGNPASAAGSDLFSTKPARMQLAPEKDNVSPVKLAREKFIPKCAAVNVMAAELKKLKSERGKVLVINNDIYVEDEPDIINAMRQVFLSVDRGPCRQILIEGRIIESSTAFAEKIASQQFMKQSNGSGPTGDGKLNIFVLNEKGLKLLAETLATEESPSDAAWVRTVSKPHMKTGNDLEAIIRHGRQLPRCSSCTSYNEFIMDVTIKPHIEEAEDEISLDIGFLDTSPERLDCTLMPAGCPKKVRAKITVKAGETVVLNGVLIDNQADGSSAPSLLPLSDYWLRDYNQLDEKQKRELLIFITPAIKEFDI